MTNLHSVTYLRAFSMLYIVGFWHLLDYTEVGHSSVFMVYFTDVVLALFVFVSGFLVGRKSRRQPGATAFYKNRLLRIYPLYALAVVIFYLCGINDGWVSAKALIGISMYYQPAPLTLWFITMLLLFYLVTPALVALVNKLPAYLLVTAALFGATLAIKVITNTVDLRLLLYFPCFCLGVFCANHGLRNRLINLKIALPGLLAALLLVWVNFDIETLNMLKRIPLVALGAYLIFYVAATNEQRFRESTVVSLLAYSSFAMYLFHRPILNGVQAAWFPDAGWLQVVYLASVGLCLVVLISWSLQKLYDITYLALRLRLASEQAAAL